MWLISISFKWISTWVIVIRQGALMLTEDSEWSAFEGISLGVGGLRLQSLDVSEIVPLLAWLWKDLLAFLLSELD